KDKSSSRYVFGGLDGVQNSRNPHLLLLALIESQTTKTVSAPGHPPPPGVPPPPPPLGGRPPAPPCIASCNDCNPCGLRLSTSRPSGSFSTVKSGLAPAAMKPRW